jgi:hypothetical protein
LTFIKQRLSPWTINNNGKLSFYRWNGTKQKFAECTRYLGYPVSLQKRHHALSFGSILQKIMMTHAYMLAARQLSLVGKTLVINSLLISKIWHVARLLPLDRHINQINAILRTFSGNSAN